jgi:hypothetical protein
MTIKRSSIATILGGSIRRQEASAAGNLHFNFISFIIRQINKCLPRFPSTAVAAVLRKMGVAVEEQDDSGRENDKNHSKKEEKNREKEEDKNRSTQVCFLGSPAPACWFPNWWCGARIGSTQSRGVVLELVVQSTTHQIELCLEYISHQR